MSSEYIIRGRVIKASTHYIIKISPDVYEKFSKFKRIKAIVSDSVNNVEFCLKFRKWSNGTHFLIPCSKKESMILHQLFHGKEVTVKIIEPVDKIEITKLLQEFIENWMFITKTKDAYIYCTEYEGKLIIQVRKNPIPTGTFSQEELKKIYFDEGFEIRIDKARIVEKSCEEIEKKLSYSK